MAKTNAVWGIDIGQCGLKAMRCKLEGDAVVADAFDFIEYPKILSQPDAEPDELVKEALEQFLSRNQLRGDKVAMSVSGQAGLSRFFKPPPVEAKTLPSIVQFEAKQQIPFNLDDVVWDYQQIGGMVVDGFTMDAEIGLFAMKRDAVFRALRPLTNADIEVDLIQLSPLSIYNAVSRELLGDLPPADEIDPDDPPDSIIILSMGTDTTDLVVTDGSHLWQRSIPLGGNHFTKQLSKELKLTYAKAEHLKRNARQAEDPKTVFQVMRPVFNDLVTEVQRSITYFQSLDRKAKIGRMVMLGNAVKLPGLHQYLSKNLGLEAAKFESFEQLSGATVVSSPSFKDNILSFGVSYGLCLQQLGKGTIRTNLLPQEFVVERMIRAKKPWALASVGALLLAFTVNFYFYYNAWYRTQENFTDKGGGATWAQASQEVESVSNESTALISRDNELVSTMNRVRALGHEVIGEKDRKLLWLELTRGIHLAMPFDDRYPPGRDPDPNKIPYVDRKELRIEYLESKYFNDVSEWYNQEIDRRWQEQERYAKEENWKPLEGESADDPESGMGSTPPGMSAAFSSGGYGTSGTAEVTGGPSGPGMIVELKGHHYYNSPEMIQTGEGGGNFVRNTFLRGLRELTIQLPVDVNDANLDHVVHYKAEVRDYYGVEKFIAELKKPFSFQELGVQYAILVVDSPIVQLEVPNPSHPANIAGAGSSAYDPTRRMETAAATGDSLVEEYEGPLTFKIPRHNFAVQFCWQPKPMSERLIERVRKLEEQMRNEKEKAALAAAGGGAENATPTGG